MSFLAGLFGGGKDGSAAADAQRSREQNRVAQERQLSEANRNDASTKTTRRAPRGRRLFENMFKDGLADNLGG